MNNTIHASAVLTTPESPARWVIFPLPPAGDFIKTAEDHPEKGLRRLNNILCEYVATYRKCDGDDFAPTILPGNAFSIQQGIKLMLGCKTIDIMKGPVFAGGDRSIKTVLENKFRPLQSAGRHMSHRKV